MGDAALSDTVGAVERVEAALLALRRASVRRRRTVDPLSGIEYSVMQVLDVLVELGALENPDAGGPSVGEVASRLGVDPSRASRVVSQAVSVGVVKRVPSASDARRTEVRLTADGRVVARQVVNERRAACAEVLSGWPERDQDRFAELFLEFANRFGGSD